MKVKSLVRTCSACPSQWEGELEDGRFIYIRFRWGNLGYGIGDTPKNAVKNYRYGDNCGDCELDGEMSDGEMIERLGLKFSSTSNPCPTIEASKC